jgi:hypothetical protein
MNPTETKKDCVLNCNDCNTHILEQDFTIVSKNDTYQLPRFDFNAVQTVNNFLIIGKRNSGKTVFTKHLLNCLYKEQLIDKIIVFYAGPKRCKLLDQQNCVNFNSEAVDKLISEQEECKKNGNIRNVMVVLEDIGSENVFKKSFAQDLICNSTYYNIKVVLNVQYPIGISLEMRYCFDCVIIFNEYNVSMVKRMHDHYCGSGVTFDMFNTSLESMKDHHTLVINKSKTQNGNMFWHKVDINDVSDKLSIPFIKYESKPDSTDVNLIIKQIEINNREIEKIQMLNSKLLKNI